LFVRTVGGDIDPLELGFTHCHDHLLVYPMEDVKIPERIILDDYNKTEEEIFKFKNRGGNTILDAQPFGAGRNACLLRKLWEKTDVKIVASTGLHKLWFYPHDAWSLSTSSFEISDLFVSEIEDGMYEYDFYHPFKRRSSIKAGVIKIATDRDGLTQYYTKVFDAAIDAYKKTHAPILTHTELSYGGYEQAKYLIDNGVSNDSIIISHMDRVIDIDNNIKIFELGVFMEYDTIARYKYHSDDDEVSLIKAMIENGFFSQILLGMDSTKERFKAYGSRVGLDYIMGYFIPKLKSAGVNNEEIEKIMVSNPARALSFKGR